MLPNHIKSCDLNIASLVPKPMRFTILLHFFCPKETVRVEQMKNLV